MTARHTVRTDRSSRSGLRRWRGLLAPGPHELGWRTIVAVGVAGTAAALAGAAVLAGLVDALLPAWLTDARLAAGPVVVTGPQLLTGVAWLLVLVGAALPALWLGARLVEALVALEGARALERRLRRDLDAQDHQLARLAERLAAAALTREEDRAELARTGWAVEQARTDLDHARDEVRQLRQSLDVARLDLGAALGARDDALAAADEAARQARASAEVARQAEQALALLALRYSSESAAADDEVDVRTAAEAALTTATAEADPDRTAEEPDEEHTGNPADSPVVPAWAQEPGPSRLAGFATVDLRVFDAFAEADLDDAALVAARSGKHAARPRLDTSNDPLEVAEPARVVPEARAVPDKGQRSAVEQPESGRDVA